jgi:hypothetical protein
MTGDVLDTIAGWPAEKQLVAHQAIREVEQEVCRQHCNLGFISLVKFLCSMLDAATWQGCAFQRLNKAHHDCTYSALHIRFSQGCNSRLSLGVMWFDFEKILSFCVKYCHLLSAGPAAHAADARLAGSV